MITQLSYSHIKRTLLLAATLLFLFPMQAASAQSYPTECMTDAEGLFLKWNAYWQSDHRDNNVIYKIERATKIPTKSRKLHYVLELSASEKAVLPHRRLSAKEGVAILGFCNRIASSKNMLESPREKSKSRQKIINHRKLSDKINAQNRDNTSKKGLAFIEYRNGQWVRGDFPAHKDTTFCSVLGKKFACLRTDKKLHQNDLIELEAKIAAMDGLEY